MHTCESIVQSIFWGPLSFSLSDEKSCLLRTESTACWTSPYCMWDDYENTCIARSDPCKSIEDGYRCSNFRDPVPGSPSYSRRLCLWDEICTNQCNLCKTCTNVMTNVAVANKDVTSSSTVGQVTDRRGMHARKSSTLLHMQFHTLNIRLHLILIEMRACL